MTKLPSLPEQQARASSRPDQAAVAVGVVLLWVWRNVVPALATLVTTLAVGWLFLTGPSIRYTPDFSTSSVDVTVRCDSLAAQHRGRYYADLDAGATAVEVACAQQLADRAAWVGGLAPLAFFCWVCTFRRRDPHPVPPRVLAASGRPVGHVEPGGGP